MTTAVPAADELRRLMTERLVAEGALHSPAWQEAFAAVPRHAFVPEFTMRARGSTFHYSRDDSSWMAAAYQDVSLITQFDVTDTATSSSTAPTVMARMLEASGAQDGDSILEVGTGTGYNTALLSHRLGSEHVVSVDVDPTLVNAARNRLQAEGYTPTLIAADGMAGHPERAPYDRLLVTCGVDRLPDAWREQVRPGGVIVAAVGFGIARLTVSTDHSAHGHFLPDLTAFMSARDTADTVRDTARQHFAMLATATGNTRTISLPTNLDADGPAFLVSLAQLTVTQITLTDDAEQHLRCLYDPKSGSWARIIQTDPRAAQLVHDGPRDLWAERESLLTDWVTHGRPGLDRYGLTIDTTGAHTLWLDAPTGPSWRLAPAKPLTHP